MGLELLADTETKQYLYETREINISKIDTKTLRSRVYLEQIYQDRVDLALIKGREQTLKYQQECNTYVAPPPKPDFNCVEGEEYNNLVLKG